MAAPISDALLDLAVERITAGETMRAVCADLGFAPNTLRVRRRDQLPKDLALRGSTAGGRARSAAIPRGTGMRESVVKSRKVGKYPDYDKGERH